MIDKFKEFNTGVSVVKVIEKLCPSIIAEEEKEVENEKNF